MYFFLHIFYQQQSDMPQSTAAIAINATHGGTAVSAAIHATTTTTEVNQCAPAATVTACF